MPTVEIGQFEDCFVIHFGSLRSQINAYTLASTLTHLADAAKAANSRLNPGYEVEILVEALGSGSFKAKIRTIYRGASNLFSKQALQAVVLSIIANFVYQHTLAPDIKVEVIVGDAEVIIEQGDTKIIVPRAVHDATKLVEKSPQFRAGITPAIRAVESDQSIQSVGFTPGMSDSPQVVISRDRLSTLPEELDLAGSDTREMIEITDVEILRAILDRSRRRWEFVWNGVRIAAPVIDNAFFDRFFAHEITIAPGDRLRVRLCVKQRRSKDIGIYINNKYEVTEVLDHMPRAKQPRLHLEE